MAFVRQLLMQVVIHTLAELGPEAATFDRIYIRFNSLTIRLYPFLEGGFLLRLSFSGGLTGGDMAEAI